MPTFVDWLGGEWFKFCEAETGPIDNRKVEPDIVIRGARPIVGPPTGGASDGVGKADD